MTPIMHMAALLNEKSRCNIDGTPFPRESAAALDSLYTMAKARMNPEQLQQAEMMVREQQIKFRAQQTARGAQAYRDHQDRELSRVSSNMTDGTVRDATGGVGLSHEQLASVALKGQYVRPTGKRLFDKKAISAGVKDKFGVSYDNHKEHLEDAVKAHDSGDMRKYNELKELHGLTDEDCQEWGKHGLELELHERLAANEPEDLEEYETVEVDDSAQRKAELMVSAVRSNAGYVDDEISDELLSGDQLHNDVARAFNYHSN